MTAIADIPFKLKPFTQKIQIVTDITLSHFFDELVLLISIPSEMSTPS